MTISALIRARTFLEEKGDLLTALEYTFKKDLLGYTLRINKLWKKGKKEYFNFYPLKQLSVGLKI